MSKEGDRIVGSQVTDRWRTVAPRTQGIDSRCPAKSHPWVCTRDKGHKGLHVAGITGGYIAHVHKDWLTPEKERTHWPDGRIDKEKTMPNDATPERHLEEIFDRLGSLERDMGLLVATLREIRDMPAPAQEEPEWARAIRKRLDEIAEEVRF